MGVDLVEREGESFQLVGDEVPVAVEGHLNRRVPEVALDSLRVGPLIDEEGRAGVPQIVNTKMAETRSGQPPRPGCAKSIGAQWAAFSRAGEDERIRAGIHPGAEM